MPDTVIHDSECEAWRGGESWRADEACDCAFRAARHRDALVQAVLDTLNEADLREGAFGCNWFASGLGYANDPLERATKARYRKHADRLTAAADALAALREAQQ
jgi:hypothetical protein